MYPLPPLNIDKNLISAAGFSSGSYNTHFLHVAMSDTIKGSGLFNGSSYSLGWKDFIGKDENHKLKDELLKEAVDKSVKIALQR